MHSATGDFPADTASVGEARRLVQRALREWGARDWEWTAVQVVSELATNAVLHARTAFRLELSFDGRQVALRVLDASPRGVVARRASDGSTTGRGIALVSALTSDWGVETGPDGKAVWCTLRPADEVAPPDSGVQRAKDAVLRMVDRATARHDSEAFARAA